jgi:hypothetical protein
VSVLRAVVDQQEEPGGRETVHQSVQTRLGLGIDPVQVLDEEEHRLHLTFAHEDPLERVQGALAALGRLERLPLGSSTGTSRSVRNAGAVGVRLSSRPWSVALIWSRMVARSSRSSRWK